MLRQDRIERRAQPHQPAAQGEGVDLEGLNEIVVGESREGIRTELGTPTASRHQVRMPFCACRRFSASSHTTDCGPSITPAVTSSPRWAGRQCMKMASGLAHRHQPLVDPIGRQQIVAVDTASSVFIDTQVSVTMQSASSTAASGRIGDADLAALALRPGEHARRRATAFRAGEAQLEIEAAPRHGSSLPRHCCRRRSRRRSCRRSAPLCSSSVMHIGHDLAGMDRVGQAVDHRHGGVLAPAPSASPPSRADHDRIDIARQHLRGVGDGLAAPELRVACRHHDDVAAELLHRRLRRRRACGSRASRTSSPGLAGERLRAVAALLHCDGRDRGCGAARPCRTRSRSRKWRGARRLHRPARVTVSTARRPCR